MSKAIKKSPSVLAEDPAILLNATQAEQLDALTDRFVERNKSDRATARRLVEIAVLTRGIAALKKEFSGEA